MKNNFLKAVTIVALFFGFSSVMAQDSKTTPISNYNYHDAFAPGFYTKNGTDTRSASGQPGPEPIIS